MKTAALLVVGSLFLVGRTSNQSCPWLTTEHSRCGVGMETCAGGSEQSPICMTDCRDHGGVKPCPERARKYITYTYLGCKVSQAEENCHSQTFVQDYSSEDKSWRPLMPQEPTNLIRGMKYVTENLIIGWDTQYVFRMDPLAATPQWTIIGRPFQQVRHVGVLAPHHVYVVASEYKMQDKNGRKPSIWHYNALLNENANTQYNGRPGKLLRNYWRSIFPHTGVDGVHLVAPMHDERFAVLEREVGQDGESGVVNIFVCDVTKADQAATAEGSTSTEDQTPHYDDETCKFRAQLKGTYATDMQYDPDTDSLYITSYDSSGQPARNPDGHHKARNHVQKLYVGPVCRDTNVRCVPRCVGEGCTAAASCAARFSDGVREIATCETDAQCMFLSGGDTAPCAGEANERDCHSHNGSSRQCLWANTPSCNYEVHRDTCRPYLFTAGHVAAQTIINNQEQFSDTFYDMGIEVGHKRIYMVGGRVIPSVVNVFDLEGNFLGHEQQYFPFHPCYDYPGQNYVSLVTGNAAVAHQSEGNTWIYDKEPVTETLTMQLEEDLECAQINAEREGLIAKWAANGELEFHNKCQFLAQEQSRYLDEQCSSIGEGPTHKADVRVTMKDATIYEELMGDPVAFRQELARYLATGTDRLTIFYPRCLLSQRAPNGEEQTPSFDEECDTHKAEGECGGRCTWIPSSMEVDAQGEGTFLVEYRGSELEVFGFCEEVGAHAERENPHFAASACGDPKALPSAPPAASGTTIAVLVIFTLIVLVGGFGAWWYLYRGKNLDADAKYGRVAAALASRGAAGEEIALPSMNAPAVSMYDAPSGDGVTGDYAEDEDSDEPVVVTAL